ncbi:diacylglycerol/lipid kinase family protein [Williamsia sp. Leaf354]|uniref:diacylglycerol/lipid kinase family protein n=1 Tax=Williamsia sp. Leaf354 TaxID=1736349 RepID=UPI0009EAF047|nr:YegS/Rv2252/BmrU family lipid kinase [Williamsia sp. Leaf354]
MTSSDRGPVSSVVALVNPTSRNGAAMATAREAIAAMTARGVSVDARSGSSAADAAMIAREAVAQAGDPTSGIDAVVVIGGDGTIGPVLEAARGTRVRVGLIPAGTGNDHARALAIPTGDVSGAIDIITAGHTRRCDLARLTVGDRTTTFGTVAAIGLDAAVTERAVNMAHPRGQSRYALAAVAEIAALRPRRFRVTVDGIVHEMDLVMASVGNTPSYGGGMRICPQARIDDGLLDVTLVEHTSRLRLLRLFPTIYRGTHISRRGVHTLRARTVTIETAEPTPVSADGELLGVTPVTIEIDASAMDFLSPRQAGSPQA